MLTCDDPIDRLQRAFHFHLVRIYLKLNTQLYGLFRRHTVHAISSKNRLPFLVSNHWPRHYGQFLSGCCTVGQYISVPFPFQFLCCYGLNSLLFDTLAAVAEPIGQKQRSRYFDLFLVTAKCQLR